MSMWWDCEFCVIGPGSEIKRFSDGLPDLEQPWDDWLGLCSGFDQLGVVREGDEIDDRIQYLIWHHATVMVRNIGFLCVKASRNHGGGIPQQMIHQFPA